jgi:hypothetical protein
MEKTFSRENGSRLVWLAFGVLIGIGTRELYLRGAGTGNGEFLGLFSNEWGVGIILFSVVAVGGILLSILSIFKPDGIVERLQNTIENWADRAGLLRWVFLAILSFLPSILFIGPWGWRFDLPDFHLMMLVLTGFGGGLILPRSSGNRWLRWGFATYLSAAIFILAQRFALVTDYPFSLSWSEGNRIWDYSLYFGRERYQILEAYTAPSYLAPGRHGLWGLPFLVLPNISIAGMRIWDSILWTVPYFILGLALFHNRKNKLNLSWKLLLSLWSLLFLSQGPIYAPLILSALIIAWGYDPAQPRRSLLITFVACFYAGISRWTWMFAPAIWVFLWALLKSQPTTKFWDRLKFPIYLGLAGTFGAIFSQIFMTLVFPQPSSIYSTSLGQPLLWYRLWSNPTNPTGVIPRLFYTVGPFLLVLGWMILRKRLKWDGLQLLGVSGAMLAFLAAGLVTSVKIGGGSNLHNLDMFLVSILVLVSVIVTRDNILERMPTALWLMIGLLWFIPLWNLTRISYRLELPTEEYVREAMATIRFEVNKAADQGEILFIDQRQFLTFGEIENVPLVMEYELKHVMNQAMGHNEGYFEEFREDLENQRFSLIVSDPLPIVFQGSSVPFGEENDAWVEEVTIPLLDYYEPIETLDDVQVWLLVPISEEE